MTQFTVEFPTYTDADEWMLLMELHDITAEQYGRRVVWGIDLTARAPQVPHVAISEVRLAVGATIGLLGFPSEEAQGFRTFASVPSSAFDTPAGRREALVTCAHLIQLLQGIATGLLEGVVPGREVDPKKQYN